MITLVSGWNLQPLSEINENERVIMPEEMFPSSYLCDCGYRCEFCENTIREMKKTSLRTEAEQVLGADDDQHAVVFHNGKWVALICPKIGLQTAPPA